MLQHNGYVLTVKIIYASQNIQAPTVLRVTNFTFHNKSITSVYTNLKTKSFFVLQKISTKFGDDAGKI